MEKLYTLQIHPTYEIGLRIKKIKKILFNRIGEYNDFGALPHLSLLSFSTDSRWEYELVDAIKRPSQACSRFSIFLQGLSHFHQTGTLFVQLQHHPLLQLLNRHIHSSLRQHATRLRIPLNDLHISQNPHLTIGSGLKPADLATAFDLIMDHRIEGQFEVNQLKLFCSGGEISPKTLVSEFQLEGRETSFSSANPEKSPTRFSDSTLNMRHPSLTTGYSGQQLSLF